MIKEETLKNRDYYLNKLIAFKDTSFIKIVTGIRRCGKSKLLDLMIRHLIENGIKEEQIIKMNFESFEFKNMSNDEVYLYVKNRTLKNKRMYLFFDEIHKINKWEEVINAIKVDIDSDIYITGSNAYLLSSEYATYLSGRSVEIKMLPLTFKEFIYFHNFKIEQKIDALGNNKTIILDKENNIYQLNELFNAYLKYGGFPGLSENTLNQENTLMVLDGIYNTVVLKDILNRSKNNKKTINDPVLLEKIILYLTDNIGSNISASNIGNVLKNQGILEKETTPSKHTVLNYVDALTEAYIFYEIKRFDIKGKDFLKTLGKYYIVDPGLHNYLLGYRNRDIGHIIENIVYFELLSRGYDVAIGKIDKYEIDFIAIKDNEKKYIQVSKSLLNDETLKREIKPLTMIEDNYEKIILTLDEFYENNINGIKIINLMNWLIEK